MGTGEDEEESDEAEAGALLAADCDFDIWRTAEMMQAWLKAQR